MLSARYGRNRDGYFWERYGGAGEIVRKVRWIVNFRGVGSCSSCRDGLGVEGGTPGIQELRGLRYGYVYIEERGERVVG